MTRSAKNNEVGIVSISIGCCFYLRYL